MSWASEEGGSVRGRERRKRGASQLENCVVMWRLA